MRFLLAAILALLSLRADAFIQDGEFANTFVNTPLAPNAPLDPNSAAIVADLLAHTPSGWSVNVGDNAGPIYIVDETVPTVQIRGPDSHYKVPVERQLSAVPLPGSFVPAEGSDKSAGIYRPSTNELWELWLVQPTGRNTVDSTGDIVPEWSAAWGGHMTNVSGNPGYFLEDPNFPGLKWGTSASSIAGLGIAITIEEQRVGVINHTIGFGTTCTGQGHVFPAQRDDGWSPDCLPKEGMIFRLPASLNIDALVRSDGQPLSNYAKMIAKAVRTYGMILTDTTGWGFSAWGAEAQGANYYPGFTDVYFDVGGILGCDPPPNNYSCWPDDGHLLLGFPFDQLQVIQPPAR